MNPLTIGAFSVRSVLEHSGPTLTPDVMFPASTPEAWSGVSVKNPIGSHNGSPNALLHVTIAPGAAIREHSLSKAEAIYFVEKGAGEAEGGAGAQPIEAESFVFVPKGDSHAIRNTGQEPLELFVVLTGAGGLDAAV